MPKSRLFFFCLINVRCDSRLMSDRYRLHTLVQCFGFVQSTTFLSKRLGVMAISREEAYSIPRLRDYYISDETGFMLQEPLVCVWLIITFINCNIIAWLVAAEPGDRICKSHKPSFQKYHFALPHFLSELNTPKTPLEKRKIGHAFDSPVLDNMNPIWNSFRHHWAI